MINAISRGFDPKIRKLCFTLGCSEGFKHEDIFNMAKEIPEIPEETYNLLKTIVHWNPIKEASDILSRYIELSESAEQAVADSDIIQKVFEEASSDLKPTIDS